MKITEAQIQHIIEMCPETKGNNTTFLIAFYETVCDSREIPKSWENIKAIMNEYKPEAITRKRRQFVDKVRQRIFPPLTITETTCECGEAAKEKPKQ